MSEKPTHVVLGGNGTVGRETAHALLRRDETVTTVGRRHSDIDGVDSVVADLLTPADVSRALRGADVAYFTVGLPYSARIWAQQWPVMLRNTIDASIAQGTHLVYLDNVYAYGLVDGPMTEKTPLRPRSRKGEIRTAALRMLDEAAATRGLEITIGRSADFYGPGAATSVFVDFALDKLAIGKPATWLLDADQPHSLTYTPDIGDALALLGTVPRGRGRAWHLPTAPALTGREYIGLAGGPEARTRVMGSATLRLGALFNTSARETLEMSYQYTAPYVFDSHDFEAEFGVSPTPLDQGIAASMASVPAGG